MMYVRIHTNICHILVILFKRKGNELHSHNTSNVDKYSLYVKYNKEITVTTRHPILSLLGHYNNVINVSQMSIHNCYSYF